MQHLTTAFPIVFDVDNNVSFSTELAIGDHPNQELQCLKRFTMSSDQQSGIRPFNLENHRVVVIIVTNVSIRYDTHCSEEVVDKFRYELFSFFVFFTNNRLRVFVILWAI